MKKTTPNKRPKAIKSFALQSALLSCALPFCVSPSFAQVENATGIADPSRISQELETQKELPTITPKVQGDVKKRPVKAPAGADNITLTLSSIALEGVSVYSSEDLDSAYREKLGSEITLTEVYAIAEELTRKYRNDGYILTQVVVPEQNIKNGNVKLRVIEGFIDNIVVKGEIDDKLKDLVMSYAQHLKRDQILDAKIMEHYLLLINDIPGVSARSVLSPSPTAVGGSNLDIIVTLDRYESALSVNNNGSRYIGPYTGIYSGSLNSVFGGSETLRTQLVLSGDKEKVNELIYGSIGYEQRLNDLGTVLDLSATATETKPGFDLEQFDVRGQSRYWSAEIEHPLMRSRTTNLFGRVKFDWRDTKSKNNVESTPKKDQIRSLRLGSTLQFMDTLLGNNYAGINAIDIELSQGLDVFGASDKSEASLTRADGDPYYTKISAELQRLQRVSPSVNFLFAVNGQLAAAPLLSAEEFGVGGSVIGRGYDSSEIVGEDGVAGTIEAQWKNPYDLKYIETYQLYGFWDAGRVWNQDATTSAEKRNSLASTGFGLRATIDKKTEAGFGVAFPLTRKVDTTDDRGPKYFFTLTRKF